MGEVRPLPWMRRSTAALPAPTALPMGATGPSRSASQLEARWTDALARAWTHSDALLFAARRLTDRPIPLRHPFLFYVGHLPAFAWNQLRAVLYEAPVDAELDARFARGIDPADARDAATQSPEVWPTSARVGRYRDRVRARIREALPTLVRHIERHPEDPLAARIVDLIVEHERMHHETLCYMLHALPPSRRRPWTGWGDRAPETVAGAVEVSAGEVTLGADFEAQPFGWDNEFPAARVHVPAFAIDQLPVSVGRWHAFVGAGGPAPLGWTCVGKRWFLRTPDGLVSVDQVPGWPVLVSAVQAEAYAAWAGARLPTEAELHRAARTGPDGRETAFPWGDGPRARGNVAGARPGPEPVGSRPEARSAWGVDELVGNGWEWTSTVFAPRSGFQPWIRSYAGYSADFFDGEHRVVYGGSWVTDARFLRPSFRNWFRADYGDAFTTFRLVR